MVKYTSHSHQSLTERLMAFRDARDWRQFQSLKNLIVSLNLEAAEMLELTQWKMDEEVENSMENREFIDKLTHEMADIFIYLLMISERTGVDLMKAASDKIEHNATKYPINKSRGNARKYTDL
ncbi:MAG: nucleotide pyrophosphohydrolase [Rhodospirillaceae bacterium]|nr:nucleotide pyrophosphohydrolase [Rhodospirillaceae bacterium]MBL6941985.1 nucleotide pyrophosphohydrolase [Rhodospirillales bacterium]